MSGNWADASRQTLADLETHSYASTQMKVYQTILPHIQFGSVTQSCLILCIHMDCSAPGFPVHHQPRSLIKLMSIESVMPSNHLIFCHPLFLLPSVFPSIKVFSNKSVLHTRWPKYWSFSFSINPSSESSGLISFRIDWFDFWQSKGLSRIFSNSTVQKHQFFGTHSDFFLVQLSHPYMEKS